MRAVDQRTTDAPGRVGPLLAATGVSVTGDGAFLAAAPLLAASLTRDPFAVATVTAAFYLPWLLAGLPAGALVDRWPRRHVMVTADLVRAAVLATLAVLALVGQASIPLLVGVVLVVGVAQTFFDAAAQAVIPVLVGRHKQDLARTNGRYWALDTVGRSLAGPPIGSATFALSKPLPFVADALSFAASAALVSRLPNMPVSGNRHEPIVSAIRAGLSHLVRTRELLALALSMGTYNFGFNVAMATFVLYATDVLNVANAGYGVLLAASALGGIVAGWKAAPLTRNLSYRQTMALASVVQGLAWLGIALLHNGIAAGALLAMLGAASTMTSVAAGSARQALTPDELLGRVVSAFRLFGLGAAGLGALIGGVVADVYGLHAPLWAAATLLVVAAVPMWPRTRRPSRAK
jgi:MFS family permease